MISFFLHTLVVLPVIFSLIYLFIPIKRVKLFYLGNCIVFCLQLTIVIFLCLLARNKFVDTTSGTFNSEDSFFFFTKLDWLVLDIKESGVLKIYYALGVDELTLIMLLLSCIVLLVGSLISYKVEKKAKTYFILYLLASSCIIGSFLAIDLLLFYIFFEFSLIPVYFLIGLWGGARRNYASIKFFLYTLVGSILILIPIIVSYRYSTLPIDNTNITHTIDVIKDNNASTIEKPNQVRSLYVPYLSEIFSFSKKNHESLFLWIFISLMVGFAIKLPMFPFHTWLPDAHVEASTPVSIVLAGCLLKIGSYGIIRFGYGLFS